jgi:hypothetical protein
LSEYESEWLGGAVNAAESKAKDEADQVAAVAAKEEAAKEEARRQDAARRAQEQKELEERQMQERRAAAALVKEQAMAKVEAQARRKAERKAKRLAVFLKTHKSPEVEASVSSVADLKSHPSNFFLSSKGFVECRLPILSAEEKQEKQERAAAKKAGVSWLTDSISELVPPRARPRRTTNARTTKRRRTTSSQKRSSIRGGVWETEKVVPPAPPVHPEQQLKALNEEVSSLSARLREQKRVSAAKRYQIKKQLAKAKATRIKLKRKLGII